MICKLIEPGIDTEDGDWVNQFDYIQHLVGNHKDIKVFVGKKNIVENRKKNTITIVTPLGNEECSLGDYIVKNKDDEFNIYTEEEFLEIYDIN